MIAQGFTLFEISPSKTNLEKFQKIHTLSMCHKGPNKNLSCHKNYVRGWKD